MNIMREALIMTQSHHLTRSVIHHSFYRRLHHIAPAGHCAFERTYRFFGDVFAKRPGNQQFFKKFAIFLLTSA
jgi:hypothetical protein